MSAGNRELQYAGEYRLDKCKIYSGSSGEFVDLSSVVVEIELNEDIEMPGIHGHMLVTTTKNIVNDLPIIGEETLELVIQTPSLQGHEFEIKDMSFDVYSIEGRVHSSNFSQSLFKLKFCSPEVSVNLRKKISKSYKDDVYKIVEKVFSEELESTKPINITKTVKNKHVVIPNLSPIDTIKFLSTMSEDEDGDPSYYFFENNDGYHYKSLGELFEKIPRWSFGMVSDGLSGNIMSELQALTSHSMAHNDKILDVKRGVLGSRLLVHDIYNKKYRIEDYSYQDDFPEEKHLNGAPTEGYFKYTNPIYMSREDYVPSRTFFQTMSIKQNGNKQFNGLYSPKSIPNNINANKTSRRMSHKEQLDQAFSLECGAAGNTSLTVGNLIEITIPRAVDSTSPDYGKDDRFFTEDFLMTRIKHTYNSDGMNHTVTMHLMRDSQTRPEEFAHDEVF